MLRLWDGVPLAFAVELIQVRWTFETVVLGSSMFGFDVAGHCCYFQSSSIKTDISFTFLISSSLVINTLASPVMAVAI